MSNHDDKAQPGKGGVQVGHPAPDFTLLDQSGTSVHLGDFLGKKHIVLYFYPKENTSICTEEACAFRYSYEVFKGGGAEIMGISSHPADAHHHFPKTPPPPFTPFTPPRH